MNGCVSRALVIGGGFSGMAAAILLARQGVQVDLIEIDSGWRSYGAGISLHGATLRVIEQLGLLPRFLEEGHATDGVEIRGPDDSVVVRLPTPRIAGPDIPGGAAIMRPALARIMAEGVRAAGVNVMLGKSFVSFADTHDDIEVTMTDGTSTCYDLVVGADGLYSTVRTKLFPDAPLPRFIGQSVWRAVLPRPPEIETVTMWMGPKSKVGLNLVSRDQVYLFLTEDCPVNQFIPPEDHLPRLQMLLAHFTSPIMSQVAAQIGAHSQIVYRPLEQLLLPRPWSRGRIVLIGDAVHSTTPHLAAGACIGIEDALVLSEEIARVKDAPTALAAFEQRRFERCRMVVENSGRLADIEIANGNRQEHAAIMQESMKALAQAV